MKAGKHESVFRQQQGETFKDEQYPGDGVVDQIEPVDGSGEFALDQHLYFFPDVRRCKWGQPQA